MLPSDIANIAPSPDIVALNLQELKRQLAETEEAFYDSLDESESFQEECSKSSPSHMSGQQVKVNFLVMSSRIIAVTLPEIEDGALTPTQCNLFFIESCADSSTTQCNTLFH